MDGLRIRELEIDDYEKGFLEVLANLTQVGEISREKFDETFNAMKSRPDIYHILVIEDTNDSKVIGTGALLVEQKFIRSCGKVGHIEDIVISPSHQGRGIGKVLIEELVNIGRQQGCYKCILDCAEDVRGFYERCGLSQKGLCMAVYY